MENLNGEELLLKEIDDLGYKCKLYCKHLSEEEEKNQQLEKENKDLQQRLKNYENVYIIFEPGNYSITTSIPYHVYGYTKNNLGQMKYLVCYLENKFFHGNTEN